MLTVEEIQTAFKKFIELKDSDHRYASFDYCNNYFNNFQNKRDLAFPENLEKSCLHLGFFVSSWGMIRARSFLLQKSLRFYIPIIKWLANECPENVWNIDVNKYSNENIEILIKVYATLSQFIPDENRKLVLVTKIMLGVFGNTPAFDDYFTTTFRDNYGENTRYRRFNMNSLTAIKEFYNNNENLIEELRRSIKTYNFLTDDETNIFYTRAKIIDMIGFGYQL
ncbi:MAG: hypothetical protein Q7S39_11935 [Ignavibacteria bacterium]|nr:hypothetical protein [Ignavibacteria bacterium]